MGSPAPEPALSGTQQLLAEHLELTFNGHRLTLTDEQTALTFHVTLQVVRGMLESAQAQGIVDAAQFHELDALIEGMAAAPRLL